MLNTFQIEFVRELLEKEINDANIVLYSFFEELQEGEEVNRYVETFKQLAEQQNQESNVGFGILAITDTPSFINLNKHTILPFEWGCSIRTKLANRDAVVRKIYGAIDKIKGRKFDIAQLNNSVWENSKLFKVGTIGQYDMQIHNGDFIGSVVGLNHINIVFQLSAITSKGFTQASDLEMIYAEYNGKLYRFEYNTTTSEWEDKTELFNGARQIPPHTSFDKWKLSVSCDSIKVEQPFTLNSNEYCNIVFGGSATISPNSVAMGNDFTRLQISKHKLIISDTANQNITFTPNFFDIEPLEINSGESISSIPSVLRSNLFNTNSHNDSTQATLQYTFVLDKSIQLLKEWFEMARYNKVFVKRNNVWNDTMSPNIIYKVREIFSSWGEIEINDNICKLANDISIENTEGDIMTISVDMQIQGENN